MDHYFNSVHKEHLHLTLTLNQRSITKRDIFVQGSRDGKRKSRKWCGRIERKQDKYTNNYKIRQNMSHKNLRSYRTDIIGKHLRGVVIWEKPWNTYPKCFIFWHKCKGKETDLDFQFEHMSSLWHRVYDKPQIYILKIWFSHVHWTHWGPKSLGKGQKKKKMHFLRHTCLKKW